MKTKIVITILFISFLIITALLTMIDTILISPFASLIDGILNPIFHSDYVMCRTLNTTMIKAFPDALLLCFWNIGLLHLLWKIASKIVSKIVAKAILVTLFYCLLLTGGFITLLISHIANIDNREIVIWTVGLLVYVPCSILILKSMLKGIFKNKVHKSKSDKNSNNYENASLTIGNLTIGNMYRSLLVCGGAGSGKSLSVIEPVIEHFAKTSHSGILYDWKSPELTEKTRYCYQYYQKNNSINIPFYNVDFKNPLCSHRCNPIAPEYLIKPSYALEYANTLLLNLNPESVKKQDFWVNQTKLLLAASIWYLKSEKPEYCTLAHCISMLLHNPIERVIQHLIKNKISEGYVSSIKDALERNAENQLAGVLSTVKGLLSQLNDPSLFYILSGNDLSLNINNPKNPVFLAIGNDSTMCKTYSPIISLIISVAIQQMNQSNKYQSGLIIDEAPTVYIPNLEQLPATARSNKVVTILGVQDFSQMIDKYGKEKAEIIFSNMGTQFFGRTTNKNTAQYISQLFGKEDRLFESTSKGKSGKTLFILDDLRGRSNSTTKSYQERDRLKIQQIMTQNPGQFCGIIADPVQEFICEQLPANPIQGTIEASQRITQAEIDATYYTIIQEMQNFLQGNSTNTGEIIFTESGANIPKGNKQKIEFI